jgi:hypothetical protein
MGFTRVQSASVVMMRTYDVVLINGRRLNSDEALALGACDSQRDALPRIEVSPQR